ncbi:MAG: hypothetical protein KTR17_01565 [Cellvibrionaceae bacterium]|nr:hypothetical protein [Cellvibrionaceae bacterium]
MSALKTVARIFLSHFTENKPQLDLDSVSHNLKLLLPIYSSHEHEQSHAESDEELMTFVRAIKAWLGEDSDVTFCPERLCLALDPIKMEVFSNNLGLDTSQSTPALVNTLTILIDNSELNNPFSTYRNPSALSNLYISDLL